MNIFKKILYSAALAALTGIPALAGETVLSLEECLEIALNDNPTVRVADLEVKRVDYSKRENLASLFPKIDFSGSYQRSIELQTMRMSMGGQSQSIKMGSDNNWNFGFSASMPLIAPTLWKAIGISDSQILANVESARSSRLDLANSVRKAYYALMLAISSHEVVKQNHDIAVMNAAIYEKQFAAGTASEYDVLRSSVQVKNLEPELLQADISIKQCALQLKVLMGLSADIDIRPASKLADYRDSMQLMQYSGVSLDGNTSLRSLDIQGKLLDKTIQMKKFAWIPTLSAQFNLSWLALSNGSPFRNQEFNPYSNVGLSLSVPVFSGGSKLAALKQAQVQRKELTLQREDLVNSLDMQVRLAIDNINLEVKQIATSEEGVHQARKAHDIMQKSFEIGAASYLDLRDSELADTSAQLTYLQAIYNYLVSSSELDCLLGKDPK